MNNYFLVGNLVKDAAEGKRTIQSKNGPMTIADITIAINRRGADGQDVPEYFPVSVFGRMADSLCQYGGKGSKVAVSGHLKQDKWEDKETGKTRSRISLVADRVEFCNMKQPQAQSNQPAAGNYQAQPGNYQPQPNAQGGYAQPGNYQAQPNVPQQGNYAQPGNYQATQNTQPTGGYQPQPGGYAQQSGYQQAYQPTENTVGGGQFVAGDDLVDDINF